MLLLEIINSCSHEKVAQAAVDSIGLDFKQRVEGAARRRGMRSGSFVALAVRCFGRAADDDEWAELAEAMAGADMPILSGLRHILEVTLDNRPTEVGRGGAYAHLAAGCSTSALAGGLGCQA